MKKMLKRADGSKSQRGLWDNIRAKAAANKKAGKKGKAPSEDILKAEASIKSKGMGGPGDQGKPEKASSDKTAVKVNPPLSPSYRAMSDAKEKLKIAKDLYQANPTKTFKKQVDKFKSSKWLEESKELKFGGPTKRKKYQTAGAEENVTDATATPKFTKFTVTPPIGEDKPMERKDNFITRAIDKISDRFSTIAGGGNKGGGSTAFNKSCLSGDCIDMLKSKGGNETNRQNPGGAKGLSDKKQIERGRVVEKSAGQIALEQKRLDEQATKKAEYEAKRAANRIANKAAFDADVAKQNAPTGVYANPRDLSPIRMNKTGGKRKYVKKY